MKIQESSNFYVTRNGYIVHFENLNQDQTDCNYPYIGKIKLDKNKEDGGRWSSNGKYWDPTKFVNEHPYDIIDSSTKEQFTQFRKNSAFSFDI